MGKQPEYVLNMDIKYDYLQKIDVNDIVLNCKDKWFNQTLCKVNGSVLRLGIFEGEFHMHKHENDDEVFYVLKGEFDHRNRKRKFQSCRK
jgi:mannose-6-phosphate isomerase-like protein (cupin superfamily)